jgi:hypothetical protein
VPSATWRVRAGGTRAAWTTGYHYGQLVGGGVVWTAVSGGVSVGVADCVDDVAKGVVANVDAERETSIAAPAAVDMELDATVPPSVNPPAARIPPYASPPVIAWSSARMTTATITTSDIIKCGAAVIKPFM